LTLIPTGLRQRPDALAFAICALWLIAANLRQSLVFSPDSGTYIAWADQLIALNFDVLAYVKQVDFVVPPFFYLLQVLIVALLKQALGANWALCFHGLNLCCVVVVLMAYWRSALRLAIRPWAIAMGFLALSVSVDLLIWPHYMLSDTMYMALAMLAVYAAIGVMQSAGSSQGASTGRVLPVVNTVLLLLFWCLLLTVSRPSSPPLVFALALSPCLPWLSGYLGTTGRLLVAIVTGGLLLALGYATLAWDALHTDPQALSSAWRLITEHLREGGIIHHRLETYQPTPQSMMDVFAIYLRRLLWFFSPYAQGFSLTHVLIKSAQATLIFVGLLCCLMSYSHCASMHQASILLLIMVVLGQAFYHSAVLIDYDWRYRAPVIAPLILLATLGLSAMLRPKS
jgi:hypothetical protein